ncbi:hypothetical protein N431DRAFT_557529 [Stipitochalara longipes BDJ]|nr:hypothetical protein N431DRAFT_557529 [Stipitochalara longipes BDJ]
MHACCDRERVHLARTAPSRSRVITIRAGYSDHAFVFFTILFMGQYTMYFLKDRVDTRCFTVLVESISLNIGIANLFSTCIGCFEYVKAAQTLGDDLKIFLAKLDIEKTSLLIWGNAVGIIRIDDSERAPDLRDPAKVAVITKFLEPIKALFSNKGKPKKVYSIKITAGDADTQLWIR